jgi:putative permease
MRRLALITATVLATLLATATLWQISEALVTLIAALIVGGTLDPAVRYLMRRGLSRGAAAGITFVGGLALLGAGVTLLGGVILGEVATALQQAPILYERGVAALGQQDGWLGQLAVDAPTTEEIVEALAPFGAGDVLTGLLGLTSGVFQPLLFVVGALTLAFYWMLEQSKVEWLWLSLLPLQARMAARNIWTRIIAETGIYVRATVLIVVLTTLLLAVVYNLLDLPFATLLALIGGVVQIVPWLGAVFGILLPALIALAQGPLVAALTLASGILVLLVVKRVAEPWLFRNAVQVNPLLIVLLLLALFELGGFLAILAAPPLAAALHVLYFGWLDATRHDQLPPARADVSMLQARLTRVRESCGYQLTQRPQLRGMLDRTEQLLGDVEEALPH